MKHREDSSAGYRHARLEEKLFEELTSLLRDDVSDPRLEDARIRAVSLSVDYRHAKVHFMLDVEREDPPLRARAEAAFVRACPFFRSQLQIALDLKRTPDLRFIFDGFVPTPSDVEISTLPRVALADDEGEGVRAIGRVREGEDGGDL